MGNTINTVNVIEMWQGQIQNLASYPDTAEGNKDAKLQFCSLVKKHARSTDEYTDEEIEEAMGDGVVEGELFSVFLVHSTV